MTVRELTEWRVAPGEQQPKLSILLTSLIVVLLAWNLLADRAPSDAQLPIGLLGAAGLVLIARRAGLGWSDMGFDRTKLGNGMRVGAIAAGVVVLVLILAAALPDTRAVLADGRFVGMDLSRALYETLVRIPLAVALTEEIAFRGVLLGVLMTRTTVLRAVVISSVLFGLWHILPGIAALENVSGVGDGASTAVAVALVAAQVIVTGVAGAGFAWLRLRSGHIAAPILVHAPLNSVSFAVGWIAVQTAWF